MCPAASKFTTSENRLPAQTAHDASSFSRARRNISGPPSGKSSNALLSMWAPSFCSDVASSRSDVPRSLNFSAPEIDRLANEQECG